MQKNFDELKNREDFVIYRWIEVAKITSSGFISLESKGKACSGTDDALYPYLAIVQLNDFPGDGKAKSRSLLEIIGALSSIELFENKGNFIRWYTWAGVTDS